MQTMTTSQVCDLPKVTQQEMDEALRELGTHRLKISQTFIDVGMQGYDRACPVALGAAAAGLENPSVGNWGMGFGPEDNRKMVTLPLWVQHWISVFDRFGSKAVMPIEFEIREDEAITLPVREMTIKLSN